jgi:Flp pilus assembly pilin Flp
MLRFFRDESGQAMVEYGLIVALAAFAAEFGITAAGGRAAELLSGMSGFLSL